MAFIQKSSIGKYGSLSLCSSPACYVAPRLITTRRTFSWWWRRSPKDWSSGLDDSFHRHMLRKQRVLRYKYSKALRRRQLWDRDPSHDRGRPTWGWQMNGQPHADDGQDVPSHSVPPTSGSGESKVRQGFLDDFAQFKSCVDKDPFSAVFGRRLVSHQKPNDTPWSSFSWIFDATRTQEAQDASQQPVTSNAPPTSKPSSISSSSVQTASQSLRALHDDRRSGSANEPSAPANSNTGQKDEYEFDPISMRKVLKSKNVVDHSAKTSRSLFDPLFAEKGVDVPVKPYKPHRVFGYPAKPCSVRSEANDPSSGSLKLKSKAESSRLAELRTFKASILGNSIDTTAEYHGKWVPPSERVEEDHANISERASKTEEAPLFSGTTYEAKSKAILAEVDNSKRDWLNREGFGKKQESSIEAKKLFDTRKAGTGLEHPTAELQPSLDRLISTQQTSSRLEPSLDRLSESSKKTKPSQTTKEPAATAYEVQHPVSEDLDLLRASDIRASTKISRRTKQESENTKQDQRKKLETAFESHQKDDDGLSTVFPNTIMESGKKLSENINNLWHRVRAQQKAWVARKVQALDSVQDAPMEKAQESASLRNQEAIGSDVKAPSFARKPTQRPVQTFTPSQEVLNAERESKERTLALRSATLECRKLEAELKDKQQALAQTIKSTYEENYGPITVDHRQIEGCENRDQSTMEVDEAKPLSEQHRARNLIVQCEDALRDTTDMRNVVSHQMNSIRARLDALKSHSTPASEPKAVETTSKEKSTEKAVCNVQQTFSISESSSDKTPLLYKVLAYDSSTLQMNIAETTSSMSATEDAGNQSLHPTEVLSRLNNVAKFLPYFAEMEKQGYEIVSGSGDVLVFKRVRIPAADATAESTSVIAEQSPKMSIPSSRNPTPAEAVVESIAPNTSSSKVRRQEEVFSGSGQTWHQAEGDSGIPPTNKSAEPGRFRKTVKRVFLAGTLTAGLAYTIGVVAENAGAQVEEGRPRRSGRPGIYSTESSR